MTSSNPADTTARATPRIERRDVAVEGVRFVVDRGEPSSTSKQPAALLLHGVPETRAMWEPLVRELARDRVVVAPDLKGLGDSEVRPPYDIPTLVHELAAVALHEFDGRFDVVGHDWGGSLALALALSRHDLVRRLVVINAPYRHIDFTHAWHIPLFALPVVPEALFALGGRGLIGFMLDHASTKPIDDERRERYMDAYADSERITAMLSYYRAAVRGRLGGAAAQIVQRVRGGTSPQPRRSPSPRPDSTLVIWGAEDPALPLPVGESVVRDLGVTARFVSLPGVGHFSVDEASEQVVELVARFLREEDAVQTSA